MGRVCREVHEWIEETVERPLERWEERWEERREERCRSRRTRIGRFFCRLVTRLVRIVVRVVVFVTVTVTKWVIRILCEAVSAVLDVAAIVVNLVLSIPIIGGIIRTILNWVTEILWRAVGLIDFVLSLLGIRIRKRMYVGIIIPSQNGNPITTEAVMLPQIQAAQTFFDTQGNINLVYTGACTPRVDARAAALNVPCNASGFFADWWLNGSYYEFLSFFCKLRMAGVASSDMGQKSS